MGPSCLMQWTARFSFFAVAVFATSAATAVVAGEKLTRGEITKLVVGKTVTWEDGGGQSYYAVGGYYRYSSRRRISEGNYVVADGVVCMKFKNSKLRCDAWFREGTRIYIMTMRSKNFPKPSMRFYVIRGGPVFRDRMAAWLRWILGLITPPISPRLLA